MLNERDPFELFDREANRIDAHLAGLTADALLEPSGCAGWSVRDVLAHLAGEELYNQACLDNNLAGAFATLESEGIDDLAEFNEWSVRIRRNRPFEDVLEEWRTKNGDTRRRMAERGRTTMLPTMAGPYPVGSQTFHYASEYATHADDMGVPVAPAEAEERTRWRTEVARFVLQEQDGPVRVRELDDGRLLVSAEGVEAELTAEEFVQATVDRLPPGHPLDTRLGQLLACLA